MVEENEIFDYVKLNHRLPQEFQSQDQQIYFKETGRQPVIRRFIDAKFCNPKEHGSEDGRTLISSVMVNGKQYQVTIMESTVETEDLIQIIFSVMLALIILLIAALFIVNRLTIQRLWKPFYLTLGEMKQFNLSGQNSLTPHPAGIDEFNELNTVVGALAQRVNQDYQELKNFMENASHELMTPLAVMGTKLDTLLQTGSFDARQSELLNDQYQILAKLTRMNKAMLLLTKLENHLINQPERLAFEELMKDSIAQFQELFAVKDLNVETDLIHRQVTMDRSLFDVLINNLLGNAIRHNYESGTIKISLTAFYLQISNTGRSEPLDVHQIFQRFRKSSESEGIGLGLTLTRQICENCGFRLQYHFKDDLHYFTVYFQTE